MLEDLYLPFKPKRRTKGQIAREAGLEPLADILFKQEEETEPFETAEGFVDKEKEVHAIEDALAGARDIIAEMINEDQQARTELRKLFFTKAVIHSRVGAGKEKEGSKYRDYFDWQEDAGRYSKFINGSCGRYGTGSPGKTVY